MSAIRCSRKMSLIWLWNRSSHFSAVLLPIYFSIMPPNNLEHKVAMFLKTRSWHFIVTTKQTKKKARHRNICLESSEHELTLGIRRTPSKSYWEQWIKEHPNTYRQNLEQFHWYQSSPKALWWCKSSMKFGRMTGLLPGSRKNLLPCNMLAVWALPATKHH